jgi:hypothetical protein
MAPVLVAPVCIPVSNNDAGFKMTPNIDMKYVNVKKEAKGKKFGQPK